MHKMANSLPDLVSFWTISIGAHIIEYNSVTKKTFHLEWSKEDSLDYETNLKTGLYDNGFAVRTGLLTRGIYKGYYLCCIDFDTIEAFLTWCANDTDLDTLGAWTRVEWHKNPAKLHVFFLSKYPMKDLARSKDNEIIEVYGTNPHLVCVYGKHEDKNQIEVYNQEELAVLDHMSIRVFETRVKLVIPNYLDPNEEKEYIDSLWNPNTRIADGNRHVATLKKANSIFFKFTGEFTDDVSDDIRREFLFKWHREQVDNPLFEVRGRQNEVAKIWDDVVRYGTGKRQQERDERADAKKNGDIQGDYAYSRQIEEEFKGKVVAQISQSPCRWIIGYPEGKIISYAERHKHEGEDTITYTVSYGKIITNACVKAVSIYQNPLSFLGQHDKYNIVFDSMQRGEFTLEGTIDTIISLLDAKGLIMHQQGGKEAITWMISKFIDNKLARINKSVDFEGFLYYDGDLQISRIDLEKRHPRRSQEDCIRYIKYLEERAEFYKWQFKNRNIDRRDWLASAVKWTVAAPFNFTIKQLTGKYQSWFSFSGNRDGGKSEMSNMMLGIHGNFLGTGVTSIYSLTAGQFDTPAKLGRALAKTTYPITISEFGNVDDKGRNGDFVEDMKNAIEKLVSRTGKEGNNYETPFPSCSSGVVNGNPRLSGSDTVIKRFYNVKFSKEDAHNRADKRTKDFIEFVERSYGIDRILGDWTVNYIWDNRQELILSKKYDTRQLGEIVIKAFYKFAGIEFPKWLDKWIVDSSLEEMDIDQSDIIRSVLYGHVHDSLREARGLGLIKVDFYGTAETLEIPFTQRVTMCLQKDLWSFIRKGNNDSYWIDNSILELFKDKIPDLTLKKLGEIMGILDYRHTNKGWRLKTTIWEILSFIASDAPNEQTGEQQ